MRGGPPGGPWGCVQPSCLPRHQARLWEHASADLGGVVQVSCLSRRSCSKAASWAAQCTEGLVSSQGRRAAGWDAEVA